jgi:hypothetical protein
MRPEKTANRLWSYFNKRKTNSRRFGPTAKALIPRPYRICSRLRRRVIDNWQAPLERGINRSTEARPRLGRSCPQEQTAPPMGFPRSLLHRGCQERCTAVRRHFMISGRMAFEMSSVPLLKSRGKDPLIAIMRSSSRTTLSIVAHPKPRRVYCSGVTGAESQAGTAKQIGTH